MLSELPRSCCYLSITVALLLGASIARAEKIRTAIPQANLNYLSIYVADAKGFFKDEGLENETVVISGPLSIAALLSGDVDYSGAGGSGMVNGAVSARCSAIQPSSPANDPCPVHKTSPAVVSSSSSEGV